MATWRRRSILAACAALSTTGALASIGSTAAETSTDSRGTASDSFSAGDPGGWSSARGNAANSRYLPLEGDFQKPDTEVWRYELAEAEDVETAVEAGRVAVVDGTVYVRTGGEIHALDAVSGDLEWETDVDATGAPAVFDGTVYVTGDGHLAALDAADGTLEWEREFETDEPVADATIAFETIYLVVDGALHALDPADGSTEWHMETVDVHADDHHYESDEPEPATFRPETVAVANGAVYAALVPPTFIEEHDGNENEVEFSCAFGAVDAETGDREWGVAFTPPHSGGDAVAPITASEAVVDTTLAIGTGNYGLSTDDGDGTYGEYIVKAGTETRFVRTMGDANGLLSVRDHENGNHWNVESDWNAWRSPIVVGDTLIADHLPESPEHADADYPENSLVAFDVADGSGRWTLELDEVLSGSGGRPAAADENTLYLEAGGELVALRTSDADDTEPDDGDESSDDDPADEDDDGDESEETDDHSDDTDDGSEGGSDDADSDCPDEGSDSECDEGDDSAGEDPDDGDGGTGDDDEDAADDGGDDLDTNGDEDESGGDADETTDGEDDADTDADDVPGFTTGAGILGGAATLEWLRRKAGDDGSTGADEPAE